MGRDTGRMRALLLTSLLVLGAACSGQKSEAPPRKPVECEKVGQRCRLSTGVLGVCEPQGAGTIACMPQH